jgi:catechol 2,3-dioxygenase-like lactoylglutathione lyase family enzyme
MNNNRINAILLSATAIALCCISCSEYKTTNERKSTMEPRISVITLGVSDLPRSFLFYKEGLGFPTKMTPDGGIVLFATSGTRLFLYPYGKLAEDAGLKVSQNENNKEKFPGFTFGHCVRKKEDVNAILSQAEKAGGRIVKVAKATSWGGYSGYFADPDGYLWEVAYSDQWKFNSDGSLAVEE